MEEWEIELEFLRRRGGDRWMQRYVVPHYLQWMSANAAYGVTSGDVARLRVLAAELDLGDIASMLMLGWRIQVMGAWFTVARSSPDQAGAVLRAWEFCGGHLTSPPFVVASLLCVGVEEAGPTIAEYRIRAGEDPYTDFTIVDEVLVRLGVLSPEDVAPDAPTRLDRLLSVGEQLQRRRDEESSSAQ